ncbi:MAG: hypothetical protein KAI71_01225 [Candidatus Pacebacteria bacterium]|nr:hypothetical protein [Candidatus Paceibacterota bacterium]
MTKLSSYDKEKKSFGNRRKDTVSPFPDLNREAFSYVIDIIVKKANKEKIEIQEDNPELQKLIQSENFGKLYAYAIEKVTPAEENELLTIEGEWMKYDKDSDHMPLVESLQGHGTGWCTVGESTAEAQLKEGDFYVYYSNDKDNNPTIPRVAIRMEGDQIGEVRGIAPDQNLDNEIQDVLDEKLSEFTDKEKYEKKTADMKFLTEIEKKISKNEELKIDDLKFLYEIDSKIEGFGHEDDPRIGEITEERDIKKDLSVIFQCQADQVALSTDKLNETTIVLKDNMNSYESEYANFPDSLTYIVGSLSFEGSDLEELNFNLSSISGDLSFRNSQIKKLPSNLTSIGGELDISDSQIKELSSKLARIGGSVFLRGSQIEELPDSLISIGEYINLENSKLKKFPPNLILNNTKFDLTNSQIKELPDNLTSIGGNLHLYKSQIKELPKNLTSINGSLHLYDSQIEKLPDNLVSISGNLYIGDSELKELPSGLTSIGGNLDLTNNKLEEFPNSLISVGGSVLLGYSHLKEFPKNLTSIGGSLDIKNSKLKEFPKNLTLIGGSLYLDEDQVKNLPSNIKDIVKGEISS